MISANCIACLALAAIAIVGCGAGNAELIARIDQSLAQAGRFLISKQSPDGAWRSQTYGALRVGSALTPYVLSALYFMPQAGPEARIAYRKGVDYLLGFVGPDGSLQAEPRELLYPVYTAAMASRMVRLEEPSPRNLRAQRAWLDYLLARQLNEQLGWSPEDAEYGGWGFSLEPPRKPARGQLKEYFFESNLSATVFGVAAIISAKLPRDHPSYRQAVVFAMRCQNFPASPAESDERFDDGGFHFIPNDAAQNKAGIAGTDRLGRRRFHSYGTMTADGVRVLIRCGLPLDHPRVAAGRRWLERNFDAAHNPGTFQSDREVIRDATYYYWTWAAAHAFLALRLEQLDTPAGKVNWAQQLARELVRRQRPDGSWVNFYTDAKEDDPLVATPWAAAALAICREALTGGLRRHPGKHNTVCSLALPDE
ncbi:MAG: prenyltransferase/squalene oxidase repeat-containing protein [Planctomycetota bacterium]